MLRQDAGFALLELGRGEKEVPGAGCRGAACMQMNSYWRWKCEECGYEFILGLIRLPDPCHRCGGEWFLKIGEAAVKENRPD
jgi:hypothetical protein